MNAEFGPSHQIYLENFSSSIKVKTHSVHVGNILGIQHVLRAQLLFMFLGFMSQRCLLQIADSAYLLLICI